MNYDMKRKIEPDMRVFLRSDLKDGEMYGTKVWVDGMVRGEWVNVGVIYTNNTFKIIDKNYYSDYHYTPIINGVKPFKIRDEKYYSDYSYTPEMIDWNMMELEDMVDNIKEKQDLEKLVNEFNRVLEDLVDFIQDKHESNNNEPEDPLFQLIKRAYKAMEDGLLQIEEINYNDNEVIVRTNNDKRTTLVPLSIKTDVFFLDLYDPHEVKITDRETFEDIVENHTIVQVTLKNGHILDHGEWNYLWHNNLVDSTYKILQDATVKIGR